MALIRKETALSIALAYQEIERGEKLLADDLRQVLRESSENRLDANAAFAAVINENGERRDFIPAIRDLQRALWVALGNSEVVVRNDTPRAVEWRNTDDGGRLVRRAPVQGKR